MGWMLRTYESKELVEYTDTHTQSHTYIHIIHAWRCRDIQTYNRFHRVNQGSYQVLWECMGYGEILCLIEKITKNITEVVPMVPVLFSLFWSIPLQSGFVHHSTETATVIPLWILCLSFPLTHRVCQAASWVSLEGPFHVAASRCVAVSLWGWQWSLKQSLQDLSHCRPLLSENT